MERVAQAALFLFLVAGFLFLVSGSRFLVVSYLVQILLTRNQEPGTRNQQPLNYFVVRKNAESKLSTLAFIFSFSLVKRAGVAAPASTIIPFFKGI